MKHIRLLLSVLAIAAPACIAAVDASEFTDTAAESAPAVATQTAPPTATRSVSTGRNAGSTTVVQSRVDPRSGFSYSRPVSISKARSSDVTVIPADDVDPKEMTATIEDVRVMSHIIENNIESAAVAPAATPILGDMGALFMAGNIDSRAIYIEGAGVLFMMTVDFPLSAPPAKPEDTAEPNEPADKTWQQARVQVLSPDTGWKFVDETRARQFDAERIEQLKKNLTSALRHASNMRNIASDESVIINLTTRASQFSTVRTLMMLTEKAHSQGGVAIGGGGVAGGSGYGGGASGYYGGPGIGSEMYGPSSNSAPEEDPVSTMTIRAKKSDIDAFAKGDMNLEQFTEKVKIILY